MLGWLVGNKPRTIKELLDDTPKRYIDRANKEVKIVSKTEKFLIKELNLAQKIKRLFGFKTNVLFLKYDFVTSTKDKRLHKVTIVLPYVKDMKSSDFLNQPVKIYCDCKSFTFRNFNILYHLNNCYTTKEIRAKNKIAIDEKPAVTNPKGIAFLCKHGYKCITSVTGFKGIA